MLLNCGIESPLDCKGIQPVNPKGNQSWIFIRRTDAKAPMPRPPDGKKRLIGKDSDAGERLKAGEGDYRGWDGWMVSPTQWTCIWASSGIGWWTGKPGMLQSIESQSQTPLSELTDWLGDTALSDQHSVVNLMNYHMNPELVCQVKSWSLVSLPEVLVVVEVGV